MKCRNCNNSRGNKAIGNQIYQCGKCGAIYGDCWLGDSYNYVLPYFSKEEIPPERWRYYDFTVVGSLIERRHGWYDPETKLIMQTG